MTLTSSIRIPDSIVALVETIDEFHGAGSGIRVALKLMQNFGGRDMKFPKVPPEGHPVTLALGIDDALALCKVLDGNQIYIPHGRAPKSQRAAVKDLEKRGLNRPAIAAALGLSERHVRHLANTQREMAPLPLFPDE